MDRGRAGARVSAYSPAEQDVIFATLAAQVQDVHQMVYQWDESDYSVARSLMERLTNTTPGEDPESVGDTPEEQAIVRSLFVQLYDLDHSDLTAEQWAAAEMLLAAVTR